MLARHGRRAAPQAAAPVPVHAVLKLDGAFQRLGKPDAPITVVEFADYECSFCRQFHLTSFRELRKNYIDTGKVRFYSFDLPLEMHANAKVAAAAAHCGADQGQFWSMREALIGNGNHLNADTILEIARGLYLDMPGFQSCLSSGNSEANIRKAMEQASLLSIQGTPTFIIGKTTADGVDGSVLVGALPYANFEAEFKKFDASK